MQFVELPKTPCSSGLVVTVADPVNLSRKQQNDALSTFVHFGCVYLCRTKQIRLVVGACDYLNRTSIVGLMAVIAIMNAEATSFSQNVILPNRCFAETSFCRIIFSLKNNITERILTESLNYRNFIMPNDIFPNRCSAERFFSESWCSRNIICPNVIFPKLYGAECHFTEHDVTL